ncbi:MAG: hypothetical protein ACOVMR_09100 [Flavobacteriales bacterium]|jgi:hypothetical protein
MIKNKGLIYRLKPSGDYLISHASNPLVSLLSENKSRIYFSCRNHENKSSVAFVDFNMDTLEVIDTDPKLLIPFGSPESFYSHGISVGNQIALNGLDQIFFMGWKFPDNAHWYGQIGNLIISDSSTPHIPDNPFLALDDEDPMSLSYPFLLEEDGIYKMWYGSTNSWDSENGEMIHVIKYAESTNGLDWDKKGLAIPFEIGVAQSFSRPTILKFNNCYHMWYSYYSGDGTPYRIGYSYSNDGKTWIRQHDKVHGIGSSDWDDHMQCYPCAVLYNDKVYIFYNGNNYGKEGFGLLITDIHDWI